MKCLERRLCFAELGLHAVYIVEPKQRPNISIKSDFQRSSCPLTFVALLTSRACVVCLEVCVPLRASLAMTRIALLNTERAHGAQAADLVGSFQERFHTEDKCRTAGLHKLKHVRSVLWIPIHKQIPSRLPPAPGLLGACHLA